jgi:cobalt-zinc-cadmium efflux system outer membrane protein
MRVVCLLFSATVSASAPAHAEPLTLDAALARARTSSPELLDALAAVEEARGRLAASSALFPENPTVDAAAGWREGADERDLDIGLTQPIAIAGQRGLRKKASQAGVERAEALLAEATRRVLREVAIAFVRTLHAGERLALARTFESVADQLLSAADRRYRAGDIAALDLNLARISRGRAHGERLAAEASAITARSDLERLLGASAEEDLAPAGTLQSTIDWSGERAPDAPAPLLQARAAEVRQGERELALARRERWPALALEARYQRDEGTPLSWAGVSVSLPLFQRNQAEIAAASARLTRARRSLDAASRAGETDASAARRVRALHQQALEEFQSSVIPSADDNDTLTARSYEVGELGLAELLLARREAIEAREAYLQSQLDAAIVHIDLISRTGGLQ